MLGPRVSLNGYATSGSYGAVFPSSPTVDPGNLLSTPSGRLADGNVMLMVPLWTGGLLQAQAKSAEKLASASADDAREMELDVVLSVEDAFLLGQLADATVEAAKAKVTSLNEIVRTTQARFDAGKEIQASVLRVRAEFLDAQRGLRLAEGDKEKALVELLVSMGADLDSRPQLVFQSDLAGLNSINDYLRTAKSNRAVLKAAAARLASAEADLKASRSATGPQVYAVAFADAATQSMSRGASVGITVSIPLFDGGERRDRIAKSNSDRRRAQANARQIDLEVEREVREAYVDAETAIANWDAAHEALTAAQSSFDVMKLRVDNGKGILLELLDSLRALSEAQAQLGSATYQRSISILRLDRASGNLPVSGGTK
jgi:outer membrane protein